MRNCEVGISASVAGQSSRTAIANPQFRISHFAFRISHFAFRASHFAFRISHFALRISHFAFLTANHLQHSASIGDDYFFISTVPPQVERSGSKAVV